MELYKKIVAELEKNPNVVIIKKYEKNCTKKEFLDDVCIFKHIIIAPKSGIYTVKELQEFMAGLIESETSDPSIIKPFSKNNDSGCINIGNIIFYKDVGEITIEEKIHWKDNSTIEYAKDLLLEKNNIKIISKKVHIKLGVKIIPFFDAIAAWHIIDGVKTGEEAALILDRGYFPKEIEKFRQRYHSEELLRQE